ncbi:MAG TPA: right-handed parallel beta-helix repeat-containing protein [bacterium]|jgi:hypothetical protein
MKHLMWAILFGIVLLAPLAWADATHVAAGPVSGEWTEKDSPYVIEGDVVVPEGQTLTIKPNVNVYFTGHYKFTVNGTLIAVAEDHSLIRLKQRKESAISIRFTADTSANPAGWGGIRFVNASSDCRMNNCVIENGHASGEGADALGGGIYCENSSPRLESCVVRHNTADGSGGGLASVNSSAEVVNCTFTENSAGKMGGGVYISGGTMDLANISITHNTGGGLACENVKSVDLANSEVSENKGQSQGGGIFVSGSTLDLANASINKNENGGVALLNGSNVSMANCSISRNRGSERGGGIFCNGSTLDIANASVSDNLSGGLFCTERSAVSLVNCSLSGNHGGKGLEHDDGTTVSSVNTSVHD